MKLRRRSNSAVLGSVTARPGWQFTPQHAREELQRQWQAQSAAGFGFDDDDPAVLAAGAMLSYLQETQKTGLSHLRPPRRHVVEDHLASTQRVFAVWKSTARCAAGKAEGSLLGAVDRTRTAMGGRLLRQWLRYPLRDLEHIEARQSAIAALIESAGGCKVTAGAG